MWVGDARGRRAVAGHRDRNKRPRRGRTRTRLRSDVGGLWPADPGRGISGFHIAIPPIPEDGDVALRIVASLPNSAGLYRLDQMIAAAARETLWLTDAYFAGTTPYVQALSAASRDGVDVRLLVPQATDIPVMRALSRSGYRPLLESGVRVYEWNGPMIHAKTAVADGRWARIGSTNLNPASWVNNWELDVVIEDPRIGEEMEQMFLDDLENATEMVLTVERRLAPASKPERRPGLIGCVSGSAVEVRVARPPERSRSDGQSAPPSPTAARSGLPKRGLWVARGCCCWPRRLSRSSGRGRLLAAGRDWRLGGRLDFDQGFSFAPRRQEGSGV